MEKYDKMVETVIQTLRKFEYNRSTFNYHKRCYDELKDYLVRSNKHYSPGIAEEWYFSIQDAYSATSVSVFRVALIKLRDVYTYGDVLLEHVKISFYKYLTDTDRSIVDSYRMKLSSCLTDKIVDQYISSVAEFLFFSESMGCASYFQLSYEVIRQYYFRVTEIPMYKKQKEDRIIYYFLLWLYENGVCSYGFSITLHYLLTDGRTSWLIIPDEVICEMQMMDTVIVSNSIPSMIETIITDLKNRNYNKSSISPYRRVLELLFLFLDERKLNYSYEIALLWLSNADIKFQKEGRIERRALRILDDKFHGIEVNYSAFYRYKPTKVEILPDWCRQTVIRFLDLKKAEGMKYSTVAMYRSSVIRFCNYLDSLSISCFSDVKAEDIKAFHQQDLHTTPEGKNAYNTRIRKFLKWLGEEGIILNPFLYLSVPCESINREYIVITLTDEEKELLNVQLKSNNISLRDKAVLLLGYRLGIRSSDIANLEINAIDWNDRTIRFIQSKTSVEMILPLTTDVGNALYRYIIEERPDTNLSKVFLRERAPFTSLSRCVCSRVMKRTFPDRDVPGSCFHVLRKTMATELLKTGTQAQTVTDFLGHTNNSTVMKYLSLDEERMRKCAISLQESLLKFQEGFNHG